MNMRLQTHGKSSRFLGSLVVSIVLSHASSTLAQNVTITNLTVPGAATVSISALNQAGQITGVYTTSDGANRTFLWSPTAVYDVGTLGGASAEASTLNSASAVVGQSATATPGQTHAFLFSGGTLSDLNPEGSSFSCAVAINDLGHVSGYYLNGMLRHAFVASGGTMTDLGTLGGSFSSPVAINNAGQVAGESTTPGDATRHAFLFSGGVMRDLGTLGGDFSFATSLNNAGQLTGMASTAGEAGLHAFLWNGAAMLDLGTLGGTFSIGYVINESGHVIGDSTVAGDLENHAFLLSDGVTRDLGTLGGGFSTPVGLNNRDQVVGISANAAGVDRAFLWQNGALIDLNSLLPSGSGWDLDAAYYINDNGQIVGTGTCHGQPAWFLMAVNAVDRQPPVVQCPADVTAPANGRGQATVPNFLEKLVASDNGTDAGSLAKTQSPAAGTPVGRGTHPVTLTVTDAAGNSTTCTTILTVVDTTPPTISALSASPGTLHPVNRQMVRVTLSISAKDNCDPKPVCRIVSITSSEPVRGHGDHTGPDWEVTGPLTLKLRAENTGHHAPRVYTITVQCRDASGNSSRATVKVSASKHDRHETSAKDKE